MCSYFHEMKQRGFLYTNLSTVINKNYNLLVCYHGHVKEST